MLPMNNNIIIVVVANILSTPPLSLFLCIAHASLQLSRCTSKLLSHVELALGAAYSIHDTTLWTSKSSLIQISSCSPALGEY